MANRLMANQLMANQLMANQLMANQLMANQLTPKSWTFLMQVYSKNNASEPGAWSDVGPRAQLNAMGPMQTSMWELVPWGENI